MMFARLRLPLFALAMFSFLVSLWATGLLGNEPISDVQMRFFESEVRPLLAEKCFSCHGEKKQKGDLRLDSLAAMMVGGESGVAVVPGKPDESLLVDAIRYESFEMPPTGKLNDKQIEILTKWVALGAPWPGSDANIPIASRETFSEEDRNWWAFQPVKKSTVPIATGETWPRNAIDHFILDRMQSTNLTPAPEADRISLVRRLYFDVIGLPPTPEQVDAFVNDKATDAYERLVDDLLNSRGYGERYARQWLDLVRYAESDGYRADGFRSEAWRYRDYVVKSFNEDKPYDRFVQEQIAGDELFPGDIDAKIALGYLRHWVYEWNIRDAPGQWRTIMEDVTDTTADVFLGLGLQCAKCHNHKFDPLLQKDYFRLQAFFAPIMPQELTIATEAESHDYEAKRSAWDTATASIREEIATIEAPYREKLKNTAINRFPEDVQAMTRKQHSERTPYEEQIAYLVLRQVDAEYGSLEGALKSDDKDRVLELKRELEALKDQQPKSLPIAMGVSDVGATAPPTSLPKRPDEIIEPGIPSVLDDKPADIEPIAGVAASTGRRAALARWLTRADNPLSTRVIVNRVWQSHFGRGLAANASDFGKLGEAPTHPELLDWLTSEFIEGGWSLKSLHRLILHSATYRQSTQHPHYADYHVTDPLNHLYWRGDTRRLQAEQIRDAVLFVSGKLEDRTGGPSVNSDGGARTIFTKVLRNSPDELLDSFDLPLFFSSNASRNTTTTPVQSLLLINSELMLAHSRNLAQSIGKEASDLPSQVYLAWRRVYGREPSSDELAQSLLFIKSQTARISELQAGDGNQIIETAKLPYRDGQAVRILPGNADMKLEVDHSDSIELADFTIETFFQLRSIDQGATVRTIVGKWDGDRTKPGWSFGVTGHGSRRKPQTLVLQLMGFPQDGKFADRALFSDQHIEIDKPYYAAAVIRLAKDSQPGSVSFYLKDLSNDDAPLLTAVIEHDVTGGFSNQQPLTIGRLAGNETLAFDGLIDDVRLVSKSLTVDQLLYSAEKTVPDTVGYWQFESDPGVMRNSGDANLDIKANGKSILQLNPAETAFVDFCHSLLNSNEFLYVR